jgi:hypothetical protein
LLYPSYTLNFSRRTKQNPHPEEPRKRRLEG